MWLNTNSFPKPFKINNYSLKPSDFNGTKNDAGIAAIEGLRKNQQDDSAAYNAGNYLYPFIFLSSEQRETLFKKILKKEKYQFKEDQYSLSGSTLCVATVWKENGYICINTTNIGDSCAYLVQVKGNEAPCCEHLNTLHNPDPNKNKAEYNRVKKKGHLICHTETDYRIINDPYLPTHGINLSRTLGDCFYENKGLIHDPEFTEKKIKIEEDVTYYLVVASDGLDVLSKKEIAGIIQKENKNSAPVEEIARSLVENAYNNDSCDNITVLVFKIGEKPCSLLVADGHGDLGHEVSKTIADHFYEDLQADISLLIDPDLKTVLSWTEEQKLNRFRLDLMSIIQLDESSVTLDQKLNNLKEKYSISYLNEIFNGFKKNLPKNKTNFKATDFLNLESYYVYHLISDENKIKVLEEFFYVLSSENYINKEQNKGNPLLTFFSPKKTTDEWENFSLFSHKSDCILS